MSYPAQPAPGRRTSEGHPPPVDAAPSHDRAAPLRRDGTWSREGGRQSGDWPPDGARRPEPAAGWQAGRDGELPATADPPGSDEAARRVAMLGYLGVPFLNFFPPLVIYLSMLRVPFVRRHAAQALNLSITVLLYEFSALIFGGLLSLDTVRVALLIVTPIVAVLWLAALIYLVLAAISAGRGEYRAIPGWLCATIAR